jgi:hypothetical protein
VLRRILFERHLRGIFKSELSEGGDLKKKDECLLIGNKFEKWLEINRCGEYSN